MAFVWHLGNDMGRFFKDMFFRHCLNDFGHMTWPKFYVREFTLFPCHLGDPGSSTRFWVKILDLSSAPSDPYRCLCHHPSISVLTWSGFTFVENIFLLVACVSEARVSPRTVLRNVLNVWWSLTYLLRIDKQQFCHEANANQKEKMREICTQTVVMSFVCQR